MFNKIKNKEKFILGVLLAALVLAAIIGSRPQLSVIDIAVSGLENADLQNNVPTTAIFDALKFEKSINILFMLLVGIGFLMVFIRNHAYGALTASFLAMSIALPLYMLIRGYYYHQPVTATDYIDLLLYAEFAAAALLIAMGAPIGRLKIEQYGIMAMLFIPAYAFNEWFIGASGYFAGFFDTGGSVVLHAFAAYFGLGMVAGTTNRFPNTPGYKTSYNTNVLCLLGSMILWAFWPSFNSALVSSDRVIITGINTLLALCGSTITTCICSSVLRGKLDSLDIANAALAGGVSISAVCNITTPFFSILLGSIAGILTTFGYAVISPRFDKLIQGTDAGGIHNLHGMPGLLGGFAAMLLTGTVAVQLAGIVVTVMAAFISGRITGFLVETAGTKAMPYSDEDEFVTDRAIAE